LVKYIEPFKAKYRGDEFGNLAPYRKGRPHRGQDWSPPEGSTIPAITDGTIHANGWSDALGWFVVQATTDKLFIVYAHLGKQSSRSAGSSIAIGEPIGKVGNTGTATTGPHLHLSISKKNNPITCAYNQLIDPLKHIEAHK